MKDLKMEHEVPSANRRLAFSAKQYSSWFAFVFATLVADPVLSSRALLNRVGLLLNRVDFY
jgi:hypothetical protein